MTIEPIGDIADVSLSEDTGGGVPSSAVLQFDASQLTGYSDGDTVDPLTDFVGSNDAAASGTPRYTTNVQNGEPVVRYAGESHSVDITDVSQPYTSITVLTNVSKPSSGNARVWNRRASGDNDVGVYYRGESSNWRMLAGALLTGADTASPLIISNIFDGGSSVIRENGTQTGSGDAGARTLHSVRMAADPGGQHLNYDLCEHLIYDADLAADGDLSSEETRLSDKWGITI